MSLDLKEKVAIPLTREEWAVVVFGLSALSHGPKINGIAERLAGHIQQCAAPLGVMVRTLEANRP